MDYSSIRASLDYVHTLLVDSWISQEQYGKIYQWVLELADTAHKQWKLDQLIEINQK